MFIWLWCIDQGRAAMAATGGRDSDLRQVRSTYGWLPSGWYRSRLGSTVLTDVCPQRAPHAADLRAANLSMPVGNH